MDQPPSAESSNLFLTRTARWRMSQRAISPWALALTIRHGQRIEQNGATVYFLGRRHLPEELAASEIERLEGTVAVVARDGAVITTFRRRRLGRHLRRRLHVHERSG